MPSANADTERGSVILSDLTPSWYLVDSDWDDPEAQAQEVATRIARCGTVDCDTMLTYADRGMKWTDERLARQAHYWQHVMRQPPSYERPEVPPQQFRFLVRQDAPNRSQVASTTANPLRGMHARYAAAVRSHVETQKWAIPTWGAVMCGWAKVKVEPPWPIMAEDGPKVYTGDYFVMIKEGHPCHMRIYRCEGHTTIRLNRTREHQPALFFRRNELAGTDDRQRVVSAHRVKLVARGSHEPHWAADECRAPTQIPSEEA